MRSLSESIFDDDSIIASANKTTDYLIAKDKIKEIWGNEYDLYLEKGKIVLKTTGIKPPTSTKNDDLSNVYIDVIQSIVIGQGQAHTFPHVSNIQAMICYEENYQLLNLINDNVDNIHTIIMIPGVDKSIINYFTKTNVKYILISLYQGQIFTTKQKVNVEKILYSITQSDKYLYKLLDNVKIAKITQEASEYDDLYRICEKSTIPVAIVRDKKIYDMTKRGKNVYFKHSGEYIND